MTLPSVIRKRLLKQRRFRQLLVMAVMVCLVIGFIIVPIESHAPEPKIKNTGDGMWWAVQTLTTVGYGDVTPVTSIGRILGVILLVMGTIMFGVLIAMVGSSMNRSQEEFYWNRLFERMNRMEEEITELRRSNEFLVKGHQQLPEQKSDTL